MATKKESLSGRADNFRPSKCVAGTGRRPETRQVWRKRRACAAKRTPRTYAILKAGVTKEVFCRLWQTLEAKTSQPFAQLNAGYYVFTRHSTTFFQQVPLDSIWQPSRVAKPSKFIDQCLYIDRFWTSKRALSTLAPYRHFLLVVHEI